MPFQDKYNWNTDLKTLKQQRGNLEFLQINDQT